ncbi:MAG: hypothetical protein ACRCWG_12820 [Sarcina sp.]
MRSDFKKLTKTSAIKEFSTIGNFEILFLILATSIIAAVYFRDKDEQLKMRLGEKKDRILYFKESLLLLFIPIIIASFAGFLVKAGLFAVHTEVLAGTLEMPFYVVFNTTIYILIIAIFGVSLGFLFQITMKPILTATLYPLFIFESLILIFGVSNLFASEKISGMVEFSNFTSSVVLNYLNMFTSKLRVEMLGTQIFFTTILAFMTMTVVCLAGTSRFLVTYNKRTLTHSYRATVLRRFININLVTLFTMYFSIAGFGAYSLLQIDSITLDKAMEYTGIVSIILIPTLVVLFEYFYMKRNNLIIDKQKKKKDKKSNEILEVTKNIESNNQNIDIKINDAKLENKGIVKETVKTSYTPKDEENLGETRDLGKNFDKEIDEKNIAENNFEQSVGNISDDTGFDELFFDEDIIIKEGFNVEIETDFIKEQSMFDDEVKIHQTEDRENSFFNNAQQDNK